MKTEDKKLDEIRHSLAHLLAAAVLDEFPDTLLGIGPTIDNGFYYDLKFKKPISPEILKSLEEKIRRYIKASLPFSGEKITSTKAKKLFKDQPFKLELINEFSKEGKDLTIYHTWSKEKNIHLGKHVTCNMSHSACFIDLCRGGHVKNTSEINPDGFKLSHLAGAYWRGDEKNPQLTRIYGLAFKTKKELDEYIEMFEEAKRRDHKKLGYELDLFTFSNLVGAGFPLFTPRGTIVRDLLDSFVWELRREAGYERVDIPHITKKELYETSGHWEKFQDELFKIKTREGHFFAMKPMNCPHHAQIYARKQQSYRDLPQRYASTTKVYRDEQTGELSGLARVRSITQDDAHVFCRLNQVEEEIGKIWHIIDTFYGSFGFELNVRLSLRDEKQKEKYLGSDESWKKAEKALKKIMEDKKAFDKDRVDIGGAAFYGPKIDFTAKDSIGREWQIATIQLDVNQPERFDLSCINEKGGKERIVMIHAAIMGSIERFMATLIEHTAGLFPLWLAPTQIRILPISDKFTKYAESIKEELQSHNLRVDLPSADETLGKRIRQSEIEKIPYIIVVGEKEQKEKNISIRSLVSKEQNTETLKDFIEKTEKLIKEKKS
ncbi:MAG: threonine--tRNA ligase [Candidatus Harrisonbacteria bacterium CG10_big_fil_rev_8_21_14_0_10_40_38]|uniref:Threonine--tRNA ligase n=1 Tax=Candidatus Harrisonbacteria bacterium CG10_big_fil_rev_8_21_14_0_10_40_38 TaxID=1974583 RepID=A0A2H0UT33_9BACT|nr:MAG: threonine--tRNA ligase [Candidatus Harrisonbacteria bacterium CG10_big_fil_rev_8_21_14_0_10_40_38]